MARRRTISAGGSGFWRGLFRTVLGMVGFNTFTICKPDDESLYCKVTILSINDHCIYSDCFAVLCIQIFIPVLLTSKKNINILIP